MAGKTDGEFTPFFETCSARVYAYAVRRVPREDVEDVVAETFLIAWRRREAIPRDPMPWLYGVARKVIANRRRTLRRQAALHERVTGFASTQPDPVYGDPPSGRAAQTVSQIIQALPESQREALSLRYWEDLNNRDAAKAAGCSETAFAIRLHRARRRLAKEVASRQGPKGERRPVPAVARDLEGGTP